MDLQPLLTKALDAHKEAILAFGQDLIRIPTENPPGIHYSQCVERIREELDRLNILYQVVGDNLVAFHGDGARTLYFHGHYDVVPAQSREQFVPSVRNGRLHGRGSTDMKAALAAMIYAVYLLREQNVALSGRIGLCIVADEETGGQRGSRYLDEIGILGKDALGMFTPEPTSGVIWNANRGAITLRVTVKGRTAHVGLQHQGVNAFERMLRVASALQVLKAEVEERHTSYRIAPAPAARSILMLGGRVEGGTNFNVVPDSCTFTVDRRFNPEEDLETEKKRLFAILDDIQRQGIQLDVEILQEGCSSGVSDEDPVARTLAASVEAVTGRRPEFEMCPGLLETRWYARRGIPAFAYGPGLLEVAHGPHEVIEVDRIYQHTIIYALAAARLLEQS